MKHEILKRIQYDSSHVVAVFVGAECVPSQMETMFGYYGGPPHEHCCGLVGSEGLRSLLMGQLAFYYRHDHRFR